MDDSRSVFLGFVLGVIIVTGVLVASVHLSMDRIKTADLSIAPPLLFVPK